jgi:hypothetical protein
MKKPTHKDNITRLVSAQLMYKWHNEIRKTQRENTNTNVGAQMVNDSKCLARTCENSFKYAHSL